MFNLRISGIVAGAAFVLSFLIGLITCSGMPMLLLRPVIFAFLFFILANAVYFLVNQFLPELTERGSPDEDLTLRPGSRIDITEGDISPGDVAPGAAFSGPVPPRAFAGAQADESEEGLGNITDLVGRRAVSPVSEGEASPGMDQNAEDSYTKDDGIGSFSAPEPWSPVVQPRFSGGSGTDDTPAASRETFEARGIPAAGASPAVDLLPDLDSMAGAFLPASGDSEPDAVDYSVSTPSPKPSSSSKAPAWAGDFNAKELASGLRTILNKEKEG